MSRDFNGTDMFLPQVRRTAPPNCYFMKLCRNFATKLWKKVIQMESAAMCVLHDRIL